MSRLRVVVVLFLLGVGPTAPPALSAADDAAALAAFTAGSARDRAVERGLAFLRGQSAPDGTLGEQQRTALTALALLAHSANGVTPQDPQAGPWARRALEQVLAGQDLDGYFGRIDGSRMYGHGIATLLLAELLGTIGEEGQERRAREALVRAIEVTLRAQRVAKPAGMRGGWRYQPDDNSADLSLSGWQLLSLHACRQIGMPVPEEALKDGAAYARSLIGDKGQVGYTNRGEDRPALRGLALLVLVLDQGPTGAAAPEIPAIAQRIVDDPLPWGGSFFFYRAYYEAVGLSRAAPELWAAAGPRQERLLLDHQAPDGSWPAAPGSEENNIGPLYATSMALLALSVGRNLLPAHHF